jgi:hypothetical protein
MLSVVFLAAFFLANKPGVFGQVPEGSGDISVRVVQGEGAINSIRLRRAHDPAVQVLNARGEPLAGATVTFLLPATGPGGSFQDQGLSLTLQTDQKGMAIGRGLQPNRLAGQFRIRVTASSRGAVASASITQTNAEPGTSGGNSKKILILSLVGAAAVGGVIAATQGGGSGSTAAPVTPGSSSAVTIVAGSPVFGPPR